MRARCPTDPLILSHGGGLDSNGGHNCSEKSRRKGLCTRYHYHRLNKTNDCIKQESLFSGLYGYVDKALPFECVSEELFNKLWFLMRKVLADVTVEWQVHSDNR